ncbi:hypothetical protein NCU03551 [Neurospora crassa OR74A]|uniref:Leucine rich repeat domain containing protein n=2 Tax=Neurospora crassa TaxID=5141 RepID=Q1K4M6_NEUCR|nr:hypothetical protein NCU03551 [Neurospora crassa OR74A]EAA26554.1 hypothetical protein NCU03551 [Neurospora crassa OR74A]CAD21054.1 putative protein [Neurospora crassa]|eukprot:XP_955790.1 hypothetical protein NCU03551 [Neurospora crassa OR74A]
MPETGLPSYQEATRTLDWLELVGPSISIRDYARLCRVSRHFCDYFLPRLWTDPFAMCYALDELTDRLDGGISRTELFTRTVPNARLSTRSLVFALTPRIRDWPSMLDRYVPSSWLPNVRCMTMIDCPPPSDHEHRFQISVSQILTQPYVVAAVTCDGLRVQWPDREQFRKVVYFDDSRVYNQGGHALPVFKNMHSLRILRATGHNMGDSNAAKILDQLWQWLWSLDLSNNRLSDRCLQAVAKHGLWGSRRLGTREDDGSCSCVGRGYRHELEGSVCSSEMGLFIHETPWTEDLRLYHPRRYHEDSPEYVFGANPFDTVPESEIVRRRVFDDSLDAVIKAICLEKTVLSIYNLEIYQRPHWGITHLYLNQNPMITAEGFKSFMELGLEQLQRFECDSMLCMTEADMSRFNEYYHDSRAVPSSVSGCKTQALAGILGLSHLFRPVFSNLQILRIHHSLVTNLPSLVGFDDLSALEKIWFAETFLLPRADLVFPNPFHPEMNPWLSSLTLTHIPRYSTGPLIERLKGLLKAAWFQEQTIAKLRAEYRRVQSRHPPPLLTGLRKIFLEFDTDLREKQGKGQTLEDFDAEALLNSGATEEFHTFGGFTRSSNSHGTSGPSTSSAVRHVNANNNGTTRSRRQQPQHGSELDRLGTETSWVRAVLQSRHQKWPQEVERRAHENLDWNQPINVTSISKAASGKTKVFVGYHHEGHSRPGLNNNGASSSQLASPSVQDLYDPWQSPYPSREQARELPALPPLLEQIQRRANSLLPQPPAYTAWPIPPSTPLPPPAETPDLLTPVPPCYTSFPYFLSPQEKQASINTYNFLVSRVLWLYPNSVRDPGDRADPSAAGHAGSAGSPTASPNASSTFNASSVFSAYEGPCGPGDFERNELLRVFGPIMAATPSMVRAGVPTQSLPQAAGEGGGGGEGGEMEGERLYQPDQIVRRQMEQDVRQAADSQARAAAAGRKGVGAGCYVFWSAWKAGLFGDVVFPASSSTSSVSRDGHGGLDGHGESQNNGSLSGERMAGGDGAGGQDSEANTGNAAKPERETSASKRNLLRKDMRRPTQEELGQMKDVIEELKKFRRLTGGGGSSKSYCSKDKGKGKQKATAVTADDGSPGGNDQEGGEQNEDSKWAGKHWMGELKVIRKQPEPEGGGF